MSAADVLNVCFPLLRQQKSLNAAKIESELEMLGLAASLDDIELAWASAQLSENLSDAIASLGDGAEARKKKLAVNTPLPKVAKTRAPKPAGPAPTKSAGKSKSSGDDVVREITSYKIIKDGGPSSVASQVNKAIKEGWQPLGSMSIYRGGTAIGAPRDQYFQVIVKYR